MVVSCCFAVPLRLSTIQFFFTFKEFGSTYFPPGFQLKVVTVEGGRSNINTTGQKGPITPFVLGGSS